MGSVTFFDQEVASNDNKGKELSCQVCVIDNHGIPEVRIGEVGAAHSGWIAEFKDKDQFNEFVEAINSLHSRLCE